MLPWSTEHTNPAEENVWENELTIQTAKIYTEIQYHNI